VSDQTLVFEPSGFTLNTLPGSGNSDVTVKLTGVPPKNPVYTIRQPGTTTVDGLGITGTNISERVVVTTSVDNFQSSLGAGDDILELRGNVSNSSIELGGAADRLTVKGTFTNSGVNGGGGRDWILFKGDVSNSSIDAASGDDLVQFKADVNGAVVKLGTGNDQLRFFGDATNTTVTLGGGKDIVKISDPTAETDGLVIKGGSSDDLLIIGTTKYKFVGDYTWENINDPNDDVRFGPTT
jgi:hypothetical protein